MEERNWITPDNEEHWLKMRHTVVTSTEVSALLGLNPYLTHFELWHNKRAEKPPVFESNERMEWGSRLEGIIAMAAGERLGFEEVYPAKDFCIIEKYKMGSSFDYAGEGPGMTAALIECKNVDSRVFGNHWVADETGALEAPPHIEIQVQYQMLLSQHKKAYIAALVGGNELHIVERDPIPSIQKKLFKKVKEFWQSIEDNEEPAPNFIKDAEFIAQLYNYAHPDKTIDANERLEEIASEMYDVKEEKKKLTEREDALKAEALVLMDDAERVKGSKFTISAGMVGPSEVSYTRKGYRNFRFNFKKDFKDE